MPKKKIPMGTVSWGTLRTADLTEAFEDFLRIYAPSKLRKLHSRVRLAERRKFPDEYLCEDLWDVMEEIAPDGCYFGATIGDDADYGYWTEEEDV